MSGEFPVREARGMLSERTGLEGLVLESGLLKNMASNLWAGIELRYLGAAVLVPRKE